MITVECAKSAEHRVLQGVFEIAPIKNHPARIIFEIGLNRLKQTYKSNRLFLSIHQIGDAARFCDRFVLLSGGRMCGEGTVDELAALAMRPSGNLEEVFLALT